MRPDLKNYKGTKNVLESQIKIFPNKSRKEMVSDVANATSTPLIITYMLLKEIEGSQKWIDDEIQKLVDFYQYDLSKLQ